MDFAVNAAGHVFVTGSAGPLTGTQDFITVRYNENGIQQPGWPQPYDRAGMNDQAVALAVGPGDDVFVTANRFTTPHSATGRSNGLEMPFDN